MRIIVIIKKNISPNGYAENIFHRLKKIAQQKSFTLINSDSFNIQTNQLPDKFLLCILKENNSVFKKIFGKTQLSFLIKKTKADLIFNLESTIYKSLKVPQILMFQEEEFLKKKFLHKNNFIFSSSEEDKKILSDKKIFDEENIKVLYPSANNLYKKTSEEERISFKEKHTDGREYFYSFFNDDAEKELMHLLKSFSVFKKWQRSNMKLVLTYFSETINKDFTEKISSYKFRNDVLLINSADRNLNEDFIKSAYAFLYFEEKNKNISLLANSLQACIPVITFEKNNLKEYCGKAAVYTENILPEQTGKQMVLLYKDENLRNEMVNLAIEEASKFSAKRNEKMIWDFMNLIL